MLFLIIQVFFGFIPKNACLNFSKKPVSYTRAEQDQKETGCRGGRAVLLCRLTHVCAAGAGERTATAGRTAERAVFFFMMFFYYFIICFIS